MLRRHHVPSHSRPGVVPSYHQYACYNHSLPLLVGADNVVVNLGERVVECLFREWKEKKTAALEKVRKEAEKAVKEEQAGSVNVDDSMPSPPEPTENNEASSPSNDDGGADVPGAESGAKPAAESGPELVADPGADPVAPAPAVSQPSPVDPPAKATPFMPTLSLPINTPVIISDAETGAVAMRTTIGGFIETDILPPWISDCVLRVRHRPPWSPFVYLVTRHMISMPQRVTRLTWRIGILQLETSEQCEEDHFRYQAGPGRGLPQTNKVRTGRMAA